MSGPKSAADALTKFVLLKLDHGANDEKFAVVEIAASIGEIPTIYYDQVLFGVVAISRSDVARFVETANSCRNGSVELTVKTFTATGNGTEHDAPFLVLIYDDVRAVALMPFVVVENDVSNLESHFVVGGDARLASVKQLLHHSGASVKQAGQ